MIAQLFAAIIEKNVNEAAWIWLTEKLSLINREANAVQLNTAFTSVSRKTGKKVMEITAEQSRNIKELCFGFSLESWTIDRLSRVYLLMKLNSSNKEHYIK